MKSIAHYVYLLFAVAILLSGCVSSGLMITPTWTETQFPSLTSIPLTSTKTPPPTQTATLTPPATLEPEKAKETMKTLLQEPVDCLAPCFWGIIPDQTTLGEAINIFARLGLQIRNTTYQHKDFYGIRYEFDSSLSIIATLTVQADIVTDLTVDINPETQKAGVGREWLSYSPDTLIKQYGPPSMVNFSLGRGPLTSFTMYMYFDAADLLIEYHTRDLRARLQICPLNDQIDFIGIWMGKNLTYVPAIDLIPLEEATALKMVEFSKLMTGDPNKACFNLKSEVFP